MALAKAGVLSEEYVLNPLLEDATFFGWWFIQSTATNTGGTTLTDFVEYTIGMQGASSTDHNTLDQAYDQGGSGVGRTIVADNGAVEITGAGGLSIADGTEAVGYVLTSDASGHGTWESPIVRQTSLTISTAQVLALNSTPLTIAAAPGAGFAIDVLSASMKMTYNSIAYTTNIQLELFTTGATAPQVFWASSLGLSSSAITRSQNTSGSANQLIENAALTVTVATGDPTAGDSDITVYVSYRIITL
jgi:hypothetical protein